MSCAFKLSHTNVTILPSGSPRQAGVSLLPPNPIACGLPLNQRVASHANDRKQEHCPHAWPFIMMVLATAPISGVKSMASGATGLSASVGVCRTLPAK
jgi:hypothetical protein